MATTFGGAQFGNPSDATFGGTPDTPVFSPHSRLIGLYSYHGMDPGTSVKDALGARLLVSATDNDNPLSVIEDRFEIPRAGQPAIYSFVKNFRVQLLDTPPSFTGNVKLFMAPRPAEWSGVEVFLSTSGAYVDPTVQLATPLPAWQNNGNNYTEQSPLDLGLSFNSMSTPGAYGPWIQLQTRVTSGAFPSMPPPLRLRLLWEQWTPL